MFVATALPSLLFAAACSQSPSAPLSPTGLESATTANADGSTLKVTAPSILGPRGGAVVDTPRPTLVFALATGKFTSVALQYRIEAFDANNTLLDSRVVGSGTDGQGSWTPEADLPWDTVYAWRVRAELDGRTGPWSSLERFQTPPKPVPTVGPPRNIGIAEAFDIIVSIHDQLRYDLGSRSTREGRVAFWSSAVAAIHYGHLRFNPRGPDAGWCIKDAGGGRPISDDVIVRCGSRDFWDLIGGVGANGYSFRLNYDGVLPGSQNVYPPPRSALAALDR
ncbi:MAG: hypothetical protein U0P30_05415 [Vicinamibacterales bacterium]